MLKRIKVKEELNKEVKNIIVSLQKEHTEKIEGIYELYDELYVNGRCESYSLDRIYYVAYTLATKGIDFIVEV